MITYVSCLPAVRVFMYYIGVVMSFHMNTKIAIQILKLHFNGNGGSILGRTEYFVNSNLSVIFDFKFVLTAGRDMILHSLVGKALFSFKKIHTVPVTLILRTHASSIKYSLKNN